MEGFGIDEVNLKDNLQLRRPFYDGNKYFNTVQDIIAAYYTGQITYFPLELLKGIKVSKQRNQLSVKVVLGGNRDKKIVFAAPSYATHAALYRGL